MNDRIKFLGVNNCQEMIGHQMCSTSELCIITTYPVYDICIYIYNCHMDSYHMASTCIIIIHKRKNNMQFTYQVLLVLIAHTKILSETL